MDSYIKLSYRAIEYYLDKKSYLKDFPDEFKEKTRGIRVKIEKDGILKGISGSIYPTRENLGLDIVYETINAAFFDRQYRPIEKSNYKDFDLTIYEYYDVKKIQFIEDFLAYDGIMVNFLDENYFFYRKDYESDRKMFEDAIKKANIDSWDKFSIDKFKVKVHRWL